MTPKISVRRKGEDLYLTLEGDFNETSSVQVLESLKKVVLTSLRCVAPDSLINFSFKTHGKVALKITG